MRTRRWFIVGAVVLTAVLASVGVLAFMRARPVVDEAEVLAAEAWLDGERRASRDAACPREPLRGEAILGSGAEALRALLSDGRTCFSGMDRAAVDARLATGGPEERAYAWDLPSEEPTPEYLPIPTGWPVRGLPQPPYPHGEAPPEVEAIVARCGELPEQVAAVVRHEDVCSPFRVGEAPMTPSEEEALLDLGRVMAVLGRRAVAAGDRARGLDLLLDGLRIVADARRGRVGSGVTLISLDAEAVLATQLATLFAIDLGWTPDEVERLRGELSALADTSPSARDAALGAHTDNMTHLLRRSTGEESPEGFGPQDHPVVVEGDVPPPRMPEVILVAHHRLGLALDEACGADRSAGAECLRRARALVRPLPTPAERRAWWDEDEPWLGPREERGAALDEVWADEAAVSLPGALPSVLRAVATLRALRALLAFRARDGALCEGEPEFAPADLVVPELDASLEVFEIVPGSQLELRAPAVLSEAKAGTASLPLVLTPCARRSLADAGAWFSHYQRVEPEPELDEATIAVP